MRLAQMQKNVFELVSFLPFNINEKKKASKRGKKEYDEKRIVNYLRRLTV